MKRLRHWRLRQDPVKWFIWGCIILAVMAIAILLAWAIFFYYADKWARLPLNLIKRILKKSDVDAIEDLKNIKGEFRYMGKLFEENFKQKAELISSKQKAEESDKLK